MQNYILNEEPGSCQGKIWRGVNIYDKAGSSEPMCCKISGHPEIFRIKFTYGINVPFGL